MEKQEAISMIPDLKGTDNFIEAINQFNNKLIFPRVTKRDILNDDDEKIDEIKDVMTGLIESSQKIEKVNEGFALWLEQSYFDESLDQQKWDWNWIYFKKGQIVKDRDDKDYKEQRLVDLKLKKALAQQSIDSDKEFLIDSQQSSVLSRQSAVGGEQSVIGSQQKEAEIMEIEYGSRLDIGQVKQFLYGYELNREQRIEAERRLSYLVEFSIEQEDWDREEGIVKYGRFLRDKGLETERIRQILKPVSAFLDWLKDQKLIEYNPIKVLKWEKSGKD